MKNIRENLFKLSQSEFSALLKVNQSTVHRWDNGSMPDVTMLPRIIEAAKSRRVRLTEAKLVRLLNTPVGKSVA